MTHPPRQQPASNTFHVTAHAIPDRLCFPDDVARVMFTQLARQAKENSPCEIHAYALMDNHIHLLMTGLSDEAISRCMKWLLSRHAITLNRMLGRCGPCWRDRYSCKAVEDELHLIRSHLYIEANPWRAGWVEHPAQSTWTSFHSNGLGNPDELLTAHPVMLQLETLNENWHMGYVRLMDEYIKSAVRYKSPTGKPLYSDPLAGLHIFGVDLR